MLFRSVGKIVKIGVTALFGNSSNLGDTTTTAAVSYAFASNLVTDSTGTSADIAANTQFAGVERMASFLNFPTVSITGNASRACTLQWHNPGASYVRFIFRVIADTGTSATQGFKFNLRANLGMRAL